MHFATNDKPVNLLDAVAAQRRTMSKLNFASPISTIEQGKAFIQALHDADLMFHFEDDPATIRNYGPDHADLGRTFPGALAGMVRARVADLYDLDWTEAGHECPIGYALEVMGHVWE